MILFFKLFFSLNLFILSIQIHAEDSLEDPSKSLSENLHEEFFEKYQVAFSGLIIPFISVEKLTDGYWTLEQSTEGQWKFEQVADGYWTLEQSIEGELLIVSWLSNRNLLGRKLTDRDRYWNFTQSTEGQWKFEQVADGYWTLEQSTDGKLLIVPRFSFNWANDGDLIEKRSTDGSSIIIPRDSLLVEEKLKLLASPSYDSYNDLTPEEIWGLEYSPMYDAYDRLTPEEMLLTRSVWQLKHKEVSGTGFFISPKHIVTNFHVITALLQRGELKDIRLQQRSTLASNYRMEESDIKITKIISLSATFDLAILEINKETDTYFQISNTKPSKEIKNGLVLAYFNGVLADLNQTDPSQMISNQFVIPVNFDRLDGVSGSPILDSQGQVVGVSSKSNKNFLFATPAEQLNRLIKKDKGIGFYCENYNEAICIKKAIELTIEKAKQGDVDAQDQLAGLYSEGYGVEKNKDKAVEYLLKAAEQGHKSSQFNLGMLLLFDEEYGMEGEKNKVQEEAIDWLRKAADQGFALAQRVVGNIYLEGWYNVKRNKVMALEFYLKAAEQGHAFSQFLLGSLYLGLGFYGGAVEREEAKALFWYKKAENRGNSYTQGGLKVK